MFEKILANLDAEVVLERLNFALAACFVFVILGMETISLASPRSFAYAWRTLRQWSILPLSSRYRPDPVLFLLMVVIILGFLAVTLMDSQISRILDFVSSQGSEFEKIALRREFGGSQWYLYNLLLSSIAPFFCLVCLVLGYKRRNYRIALSGLILTILTVIGKLATLSKAPVVVFVVQMMLAWILVRQKSVSRKTTLWLAGIAFAGLSLVTAIAIPNLEIQQIPEFLYYRIFMVSNEVLLEYFAAIPEQIPHTWGTQIGLVASLLGNSGDFIPNYSAVSAVTRGSYASTSTAMFIADAWGDFSWFGVIVFSFLAGAIVKGIDIYALRRGKTDEGVAIIVAGYYGVFTALSTSLTTAMLTGGLITVPLLSASMILVSRSIGTAFPKVALNQKALLK